LPIRILLGLTSWLIRLKNKSGRRSKCPPIHPWNSKRWSWRSSCQHPNQGGCGESTGSGGNIKTHFWLGHQIRVRSTMELHCHWGIRVEGCWVAPKISTNEPWRG
jgi:hypothetical protein